MSQMVEIRAIVRQEMLDRVVQCLKAAGVPRLTICGVHAIGAEVDPALVKVSTEEGTECADKAMVQFTCVGERRDMLTGLICLAARTGRPDDGIVAVHPVLDVTTI